MLCDGAGVINGSMVLGQSVRTVRLHVLVAALLLLKVVPRERSSNPKCPLAQHKTEHTLIFFSTFPRNICAVHWSPGLHHDRADQTYPLDTHHRVCNDPVRRSCLPRALLWWP